MPYSRKRCRYCGRPAGDGRTISVRGRCSECAWSRILLAGRVAVSLSTELYPASVENAKAAARRRYARERAAGRRHDLGAGPD